MSKGPPLCRAVHGELSEKSHRDRVAGQSETVDSRGVRSLLGCAHLRGLCAKWRKADPPDLSLSPEPSSLEGLEDFGEVNLEAFPSVFCHRYYVTHQRLPGRVGYGLDTRGL